HSDEVEQFIRQEIARKLWRPRLPNAGARERGYMKLLRKFSWDESLVVILKVKAAKYADALARCLPLDEFTKRGKKWVTLPGCYYTRKPVTGKTDKALYTAAMELLIEASAQKDGEKKWLAQYLLEG